MFSIHKEASLDRIPFVPSLYKTFSTAFMFEVEVTRNVNRYQILVQVACSSCLRVRTIEVLRGNKRSISL